MIFARKKFRNNCERTVNFEIVLAFEWWFIIFGAHAYSIYKVRKHKMTKLGYDLKSKDTLIPLTL